MRVFISYSDADFERANDLYHRLVGRGFDAWIAPAHLSGGARLSSIHDQLAACEAFLVLISQVSAGSNWVKHEISTAIALNLECGKPRIVPVFLDAVQRPPELSDFVSCDLAHGDYDQAVERVVASIMGEEMPDPRLTGQFQRYLLSLATLDDKNAEEISLTYSVAMPSSPVKSAMDREILDRGKRMVTEGLKKASVPSDVRQRVLDALELGREIPLLGVSQRRESLDWVRHADDALLRFAAALWKARALRGVTLNWVLQFLRRTDSALQGIDYYKAAGTYEWKASQVVNRAADLGLLIRSTENPRGFYEKRDAAVNPSYDLGPAVFTIGRLASDFLDSSR